MCDGESVTPFYSNVMSSQRRQSNSHDSKVKTTSEKFRLLSVCSLMNTSGVLMLVCAAY